MKLQRERERDIHRIMLAVIHRLGGCHRWVSMKFKFALVLLVAYIEKCSVWY